MVLPVLIALLQAPVPLPSPSVEVEARPVRIWLGTTGLLVRGQSVPVFVQAAQDGDLIVLHRRTDGRIEVLFPSNPAADPFVHSGTYEIRGAGNRAAWVVSEPEGSGMILAALSVDPLRFDEFVHTAGWNPGALVPSWNDANAEGALSDIVQRMLGDGAFNYDLVTYTVAPPIYAQQPSPSLPAPSTSSDLAQGDEQQPDTTPNYGSYPVCLNCTFIGYEEIIIAPEHHRGGRGIRQQDDGICGIHTPCAESQKTHALALARPMAQSPVVTPRSRPVEAIQYRSRVPPTGSVAAATPRTRVAFTPLRHVRFTSLSAPEADRRVVLTTAEGAARPANGAKSGRGGRAGVADVGGGGAVGGRAATAVAGRSERGTVMPRARVEAQPTPQSAGVAVASGRAPAGPARGIALPSTGFQGAQARVPANRGGTRRR